MNILLTSSPYKAMRYPTLGDWYYSADGTLNIVVAEEDEKGRPLTSKERKLILLHELIEVWLCEEEGVSQKVVDAFDLMFEDTRAPFDDSEPGDSLASPYRTQHRRAMLIEHLMASFFGMTDYGVIT